MSKVDIALSLVLPIFLGWMVLVLIVLTFHTNIETQQAHNFCKAQGYDAWGYSVDSWDDVCIKHENGTTKIMPINITDNRDPIEMFSIIFAKPTELEIRIIKGGECDATPR